MKAEVYYGSLKKAGKKSQVLARLAEDALNYKREEPHPMFRHEIDTEKMTVSEMLELIPLLEESEDTRSIRVIRALESFNEGDFKKKVPSYPAFPRGLTEFLRANHKRGWLFYQNGGIMYPAAIESIKTYTPSGRDKDDKPRCTLTLSAYGPSEGYRAGRQFSTITFNRAWEPSDVVRKSIPDILTEAGLFIETDELLAEYDDALHEFDSDMVHRFAEQLVVSSRRRSTDDDLGPGGMRKVIHDIKVSEMKARPAGTDSHVLLKDVAMPVHPCIFVFDLLDHGFRWHHVSELKPYEYDPTLRDKLVLPQSHRDLLDVLTDDLSVFSGDIIRGKSAGNIIICKGLPGLGKTLTAEVYSELIETPIYSVHSGTMGTSPSAVEDSLKTIFKRQRRWGCIVLLDEADVFVKSRGDDLNQNAIVAEFLRTLEYFEGLMFMTTNRPDDIDDAVISRAAAIITYSPPSESHRARIWEVMFAQNEVEAPKGLIAALVDMFPAIAPRDIKMLLRLVLRVAKARDLELKPDLFRRIAMFRAVEIADAPEPLDDEDDLI